MKKNPFVFAAAFCAALSLSTFTVQAGGRHHHGDDGWGGGAIAAAAGIAGLAAGAAIAGGDGYGYGGGYDGGYAAPRSVYAQGLDRYGYAYAYAAPTAYFTQPIYGPSAVIVNRAPDYAIAEQVSSPAPCPRPRAVYYRPCCNR